MNLAPARFSLIEMVHKAIRNALSHLSLQAGSTDFSNKEEVLQLKTATQTIIDMLNEHAHIENEHILPLLEGKVPAGTIHDKEEHDIIHAQQEELLVLLNEILRPGTSPADAIALGHVFYQNLSLVHSAHLQHMIEEERGSQVLIWQHYTDEELQQKQGQIMQHLDPSLLLKWMRYFLPALNARERERMLAIQKAKAPEHVWAKLQELMQEVLPAAAV